MDIISESMVYSMGELNMIKTKYGLFTEAQIRHYIKEVQRMIFWCILYTDPKTANDYPDINVSAYQKNIMKKIVGFNSVLFYPNELVNVIVILEAALNLFESDNYTFPEYRKLILDAGAVAGSMRVGDSNGSI